MKIALLGNQARAMVNFWSVLVRRMRARGYAVVCMVPDGDAAANTALRALGAEVRHYPLDRKGLNPVRDFATTGALVRLLKAEQPQMLFTFTIKPVIYGCIAARMAGVPHVFATITGLGYTFEADSAGKKLVHLLAIGLYKMALAGAETVFFQNEDDLALFRRKGILRAQQPTVLCRGTGVDITHFAFTAPPACPPVFLLVGRLIEAKGLYEYAEAARLVKKTSPQARFQLLGPPESGLGAVPLDTVRAWEREGCIEYLGETRDVRPYLTAASVMVLPSWREGTPCSVMEGMSTGRAAIVTDAPGCREVVTDGENGFLVPLKNPPALAAAMQKFIDNPQLVVSMGAAGRALAEAEFDAEKVAAHIISNMGA
ncbi:MAG: glycosyltransferase family 4 protein [Desulfovibrionaceae bacterium]